MPAPEQLKEELYRFCLEYADTRIAQIEQHILGIQESMSAETKSSAGDKHETGRAMLQLEREQLGRQLSEAEKSRLQLRHVRINQKHEKISPGSLVHTSHNSYFIAISSGEYKLGNKTVYCISAETPIGRLLLGRYSGDQITFRNMTMTVTEVL